MTAKPTLATDINARYAPDSMGLQRSWATLTPALAGAAKTFPAAPGAGDLAQPSGALSLLESITGKTALVAGLAVGIIERGQQFGAALPGASAFLPVLRAAEPFIPLLRIASGLATLANLGTHLAQNHIDTLADVLPGEWATPERRKWLEALGWGGEVMGASGGMLQIMAGGAALLGMAPVAASLAMTASVFQVLSLAMNPAKIVKFVRAVKNGVVGTAKWGGEKAKQAGSWVTDKWSGAKSLAGRVGNGIATTGRAVGDGTQRSLEASGTWLMENREWIGDALQTSSKIFSALSLVTGVAATALALTGVGAPIGAALGVASLTFGATAAATRAWYSTTLALGTLDSVSPDAARKEAGMAAIDTVLAGASVALSSSRAIAGAEKMSDAKSIAPLLHNDGRTVLQINKITNWLNDLLGLPLAKVLRNPVLAQQFKALDYGFQAAQMLKAKMDGGFAELAEFSQIAAAGVGKAWDFGRGKAVQDYQSAKNGVMNGANRALNFGKGIWNRAFKAVGNATGAAHEAAFGPIPRDGELSGPFYPIFGPHKPQTPLEAARRGALIFINGIQTNYEQHCEAAQALAQRTGETVIGVYNATASPDEGSKLKKAWGGVRDFGQTISDKIGVLGMGARNPAIVSLKNLIREVGDMRRPKGGLKLYAHSQGSIIVSEALRELAQDEGRDLSDLDVTTFGNAAWTMPRGLRKERHFSFDSDTVSATTGSTSLIGRLMPDFLLKKLGMQSTAHNSFLLHHQGAGIAPHGIFSKEQSAVTYLQALPDFQKKEAAVRQKRVAAGRPGDRITRKEHTEVVGQATGATAFAWARMIGAGVSNLIGRGYDKLDSALTGFGRHVPLTPNPLGVPFGPSWDQINPFLRGAGRGIDRFGAQIGQSADRHFEKGVAVQRQGNGARPAVDAASLRADLLRQSAGFAPDTNLRGQLAPHLGFDPSGARLHTGPVAAHAARGLNAEAFTVGNDVFFGANRFDPASRQGLGLIGHELTHVGQQTGTTGHKTRFYSERGGDEMEREAQQVAQRVQNLLTPKRGLSVEQSSTFYQGIDGEEVTSEDAARLETISRLALGEASRLLESVTGDQACVLNEISVAVELDLSNWSDEEAAAHWGKVLAQAVKAQCALQVGRDSKESAKGIQRAVTPAANPTAVPRPEPGPTPTQGKIPPASEKSSANKFEQWMGLDALQKGADSIGESFEKTWKHLDINSKATRTLMAQERQTELKVTRIDKEVVSGTLTPGEAEAKKESLRARNDQKALTDLKRQFKRDAAARLKVKVGDLPTSEIAKAERKAELTIKARPLVKLKVKSDKMRAAAMKQVRRAMTKARNAVPAVLRNAARTTMKVGLGVAGKMSQVRLPPWAKNFVKGAGKLGGKFGKRLPLLGLLFGAKDVYNKVKEAPDGQKWRAGIAEGLAQVAGNFAGMAGAVVGAVIGTAIGSPVGGVVLGAGAALLASSVAEKYTRIGANWLIDQFDSQKTAPDTTSAPGLSACSTPSPAQPPAPAEPPERQKAEFLINEEKKMRDKTEALDIKARKALGQHSKARKRGDLREARLAFDEFNALQNQAVEMEAQREAKLQEVDALLAAAQSQLVKPDGSPDNQSVATPYQVMAQKDVMSAYSSELKEQSVSIPNIQKKLQQAEAEIALVRQGIGKGLIVYRSGTAGRSFATGGQFWSVEDPRQPLYYKRYGIDPKNVTKPDFVQVGLVLSDKPHVIRPAPPFRDENKEIAVDKAGNAVAPGGGLEVLTTPGGVLLLSDSDGTINKPPAKKRDPRQAREK